MCLGHGHVDGQLDGGSMLDYGLMLVNTDGGSKSWSIRLPW